LSSVSKHIEWSYRYYDWVCRCYPTSTFPDRLNEAQVDPIHKKNSVLEKGNYRLVSVLPAISKKIENAIQVQLVNYFENIFNPFLAAFLSGFGCQSTLLRVIEDWKHALDKIEYLVAILMDLSKAFDSITCCY
jgi:hypothetical protein